MIKFMMSLIYLFTFKKQLVYYFIAVIKTHYNYIS